MRSLVWMLAIAITAGSLSGYAADPSGLVPREEARKRIYDLGYRLGQLAEKQGEDLSGLTEDDLLTQGEIDPQTYLLVPRGEDAFRIQVSNHVLEATHLAIPHSEILQRPLSEREGTRWVGRMCAFGMGCVLSLVGVVDPGLMVWEGASGALADGLNRFLDRQALARQQRPGARALLTPSEAYDAFRRGIRDGGGGEVLLQTVEDWFSVHPRWGVDLITGDPVPLMQERRDQIAAARAEVSALPSGAAEIGPLEQAPERAGNCEFCGDALNTRAIVPCSKCNTFQHEDCARHGGGQCVTYGCDGAATLGLSDGQ